MSQPPTQEDDPGNPPPLVDLVRLDALERTGLMDSLPQAAFERLTRLAAELLSVPVSLVSLVGSDRQFFASSVGLPEPWATRRETPLTHSFCRHVVETGEPLVVTDARLDPALRDNGAVADIGVVAYAGMPLTLSSGETLGSFCAIDGDARRWDARELGILRDLAASAITEIELRLALAASERRSRTDALTGLLNHGAFHEALGSEVARAGRHRGRLALVLFDVDRFKEVNDSRGHRAGDRALAEIARRLTTCRRPEDVLARVGGEELAWLLPETDAVGAREAAERARRAAGGREIPGVGLLTLSAGVADLAGSGGAEALYARADAALYAAKRAGRDRVCVAVDRREPPAPRPSDEPRVDPLRDRIALRRMFRDSPDAMWVYRPADLAILDVNDPALALYGYTREEFLGMTLRDLRPPSEEARLLASVNEGPQRTADRGEWRHRRRDGGELFVRIETHEIDGSRDGNRLVVAHDLTSHRAAERDARRRRDEQASLAEIARAVAEGRPPDEVMALAVAQTAHLVGAGGALVARRECERMRVLASSGPGPRGVHPVRGASALSRALVEGRVQQEFLRANADAFSEQLAEAGWQAALAVPIRVSGEPWGAFCVLTREVFAAEAAGHLAGVAALIGLALAAATQSAALVSHAREQEALGTIARMAAGGAPPERIFGAVAEQVVVLSGADAGAVCRFQDGTSVVAGVHGEGAGRVGARAPLDGNGALPQVSRTGRAARVSYGRLAPGDPAAGPAQGGGFTSGAAVPVRVGRALWGAVIIATRAEAPLPADVEERLERFAELVAVAISAAEERRELARHAREQAALRRVATLVAKETDPAAVAVLVAEEAARLVGADAARVIRIPDAVTGAVVAAWPPALDAARPAAGAPLGVPALAAPVRVGRVAWGSLAVYTDDLRPLDPGAGDRLHQLAELVGMALANAESRARLVELASHDMLTGLPHHRTLHERLEREVADARGAGRPLSLVIAGVDHLRAVNERLGYEGGDPVLEELARRLGALAGPDDLVARIGGDTFAWVLPGVPAGEALAAAERLRTEVSGRPFPGAGVLTVSVGVADMDHAEDAPSLSRQADAALHWSKRHGRNRVTRYAPELVTVPSAEERAERAERQRALAGIRALARVVDAKDPATRLHSERVADLAVRLAAAVGWTPERTALLHEAGLLHDVGKIGVPDAILFKSGRLTPDEFAQVQRHAELGARIVEDVLSAEQVAWVRGHHERPDGRGYPDGLAGAAVPEGARILALADAWDVMTLARPYSSPMPLPAAVEECRRESGRQFFPELVTALERLREVGALDPVAEPALAAAEA